MANFPPPELWVPWLLVALVAWAAFAAVSWRPRRRGKPGGLQLMGAVLLGVGEPLDPPTQRVAEARDERRKKNDDSGDPPDPGAGA